MGHSRLDLLTLSFSHFDPKRTSIWAAGRHDSGSFGPFQNKGLAR